MGLFWRGRGLCLSGVAAVHAAPRTVSVCILGMYLSSRVLKDVKWKKYLSLSLSTAQQRESSGRAQTRPDGVGIPEHRGLLMNTLLFCNGMETGGADLNLESQA